MRSQGTHIGKSMSLMVLLLASSMLGYGCSSKSSEGVQQGDQAISASKRIRPGENSARAVWGHMDGIRVGIHPMSGPRGLLRVYTPYLGHKSDKMINFIAFEPIVKGDDQRGFSELEYSQLDKARGKRFWSSDSAGGLNPTEDLASGVVEVVDNKETLTVFIHCEPFDNGAKVYVSVRFFEDRPHEIELKTFTVADSKALDHFILTATMGNYARLRNLHLADTIISSLAIWPEYKDIHFTTHTVTEVGEMIKDDLGTAYFIASPNEDNPADVQYAVDTKDHWKYYGDVGTQYWQKPQPHAELKGLVNGRYTYWASKAPIPRGISFENFELKEPFQNGASFIFGVSPNSPEELIKTITNL